MLKKIQTFALTSESSAALRRKVLDESGEFGELTALFLAAFFVQGGELFLAD